MIRTPVFYINYLPLGFIMACLIVKLSPYQTNVLRSPEACQLTAASKSFGQRHAEKSFKVVLQGYYRSFFGVKVETIILMGERCLPRPYVNREMVSYCAKVKDKY